MTSRWLGLLALVTSGVILFIWIPLDVDTGIIEKVRRQTQLGDAFAPSIAAFLIGLGGLMLLLERTSPRPQSTPQESGSESSITKSSLSDSPVSDLADRKFGPADLYHGALVFLLLAVALGLMRYTGPWVVTLFAESGTDYRLLRDTAPWKYLGFVTGGVWLIVSLIVLTERRFRMMHFFVAIAVVVLLIVFYDLPFDDLLLPPNGDV